LVETYRFHSHSRIARYSQSVLPACDPALWICTSLWKPMLWESDEDEPYRIEYEFQRN